MGDAKPTVVVTGISGNLGTRLLPQLGGFNVIGLDVNPPVTDLPLQLPPHTAEMWAAGIAYAWQAAACAGLLVHDFQECHEFGLVQEAAHLRRVHERLERVAAAFGVARLPTLAGAGRRRRVSTRRLPISER